MLKALCLAGLALSSMASWGTPRINQGLSQEEKMIRLSEKKRAFGGVTFRSAGLVEAGKEPVVSFNAHDSVFVHWEIPRYKLNFFLEEVALPQGMNLTPVRIKPHEPPRYYLTLNVYKVDLGKSQVRAEWSVYAKKDGSIQPRRVIIDSHSSIGQYTPDKGQLAAAQELTIKQDQHRYTFMLNDFDKQVSIDFKKCCHNQSPPASRQWIRSNDEIYWPNGVVDRGFYNSTLIDARPQSLAGSEVKIVNRTKWAHFTPEDPIHMFYYPQVVEFALMPWSNLNDSSLALEPGQRESLKAAKSQIYSKLLKNVGVQIQEGLAESMASFVVDKKPYAYWLNFKISSDKIHELERKIIPPGLQLTKMNMLEGEPAEYMLSVNVYQASGLAQGLRVEYSVYVSEIDDPEMAYFLVVDVESDQESLDPVDLFTQPAEYFTYTQRPDRFIETSVRDAGAFLNINFPLPVEKQFNRRLNSKWVQANDKVYWLNGIYDRLLYNGGVLDAAIAKVNLKDLSFVNNTPWAHFVEAQPIELLVFAEKQDYQIQAWFNMEEI